MAFSFLSSLGGFQPNDIRDVIPKLKDPEVDLGFAKQQIELFQRSWSAERDDGRSDSRGWSSNQKVAVDSGIVGGFITFIKNEKFVAKDDKEWFKVQWLTLECITLLVYRANLAQRRKINDELAQYNALDVVLEIVEHSPIWMIRNSALILVRVFCAVLFAGESLSPEKTADVIEACCRFTLDGPDSSAKEMLDPKKNWQRQYSVGAGRILSAKDTATYTKRQHVMAQENAFLAAAFLLCRDPPPSRQFCLDILRYKPTLLDQLLDIVALPRPAWYPETQVDATACEVIAALLQFPIRSVPGMAFPLEGRMKEEYDADMNSTMEALDIFVKREGWLPKVVAIWEKGEETYKDLMQMFSRVKRHYHAEIEPDSETYESAYEYRGQRRIAILRIIASVTYADAITDGQILTLLRPAYIASQKIDTPTSTNGLSHQDELKFTELFQETARSPMWGVTLRPEIELEPSIIISPGTLLGPLALVRLLTRVTERGLLDQIPGWSRVPNDLGVHPSITLSNIKQITKAPITKKCLTYAFNQLLNRYLQGDERVEQGRSEYSCAIHAYTSASELGSALLTFNEASGGTWSDAVVGVKPALSECSLKSADTALKLKEYAVALRFGLMAEKFGREISDTNITQKSIRIIQAARRQLNA